MFDFEPTDEQQLLIETARRFARDELSPVAAECDHSGKFPEGVLAGRIVSVQRENLGLFQKVVVEPAVNFSRLREVFVITETREEPEARGSRSARGRAKE